MKITDLFAKCVQIMGFYFLEELSGLVGEVPGQAQSGVLNDHYLMVVNQNQDDLDDPASELPIEWQPKSGEFWSGQLKAVLVPSLFRLSMKMLRLRLHNLISV